MRRETAIAEGHVWTDFNGCEEHVCALDLDHGGPCICDCLHDADGNYRLEAQRLVHEYPSGRRNR